MNQLQLVPENIGIKVEEMIATMSDAFLEIQQPRTDFAIKHFVLGQHDTEPQQYAQCVLELQIKYDNIRRALLNKRKIQLKIDEHEAAGTELDLIEADLARIDLEEQDRAMLGAWREFQCLYNIWQQFPKKYTRQELDEAQPEYWRKRLARQARQDVLATGRVQVGNMESLKQIGFGVIPELDHVREVEQKYLELKDDHVREIEKKYLEKGDCKVLLVVATREKAKELPCIKELCIPSGIQVKYYNVWGRSVHDAYNDAAMTALKDEADFLLTVEDDTYPPSDAFGLLLKLFQEHGPKVIVGAWYPKKQALREGTPIVIKNGKRCALMDDGKIHEVYTIPMGTTLFPTRVFLETDFPYFATTEHLSQDSFFSQKARDVGYKLLVDTKIKCKHLDVHTNKVYE